MANQLHNILLSILLSIEKKHKERAGGLQAKRMKSVSKYWTAREGMKFQAKQNVKNFLAGKVKEQTMTGCCEMTNQTVTAAVGAAVLTLVLLCL